MPGTADWDAFVEATPGGDHLQTSGWARTKEGQGLESSRVIVEESGAIVAGAQLLIRRIPVLGRVGYVPRGPVMAELDVGRAAEVIRMLQDHARRHGIRHLVVQPPRSGDWIASLLASQRWVPGAVNVAPSASVLIDLRPGRDELFASMSKSTRKHVRRGAARGVEVREGGFDDLAAFHRLLVDSGRRHGFQPYPARYYETMWEALGAAGHIGLFVAEFQGEMVSAHLVVPFGEVFLSKVAAWSGRYPEVYANETLEWHMIDWAKAHGFRWYDMEGFNRAAAEHLVADPGGSPPLSTVDAFKLKFGGSAVLLPTAFDFFPSRVLASTYGRAYRTATAGGWPRPTLGRLRTRPADKSR